MSTGPFGLREPCAATLMAGRRSSVVCAVNCTGWHMTRIRMMSRMPVTIIPRSTPSVPAVDVNIHR